jgi:hypothetical protein
VSKYFRHGDLVLWNPSNQVAELFLRTAETLAAVEERPTGIGPMRADEHHLDLDAYGAFVDALARRYLASRHAIHRALVEGFLATALVLTRRAGHDIPALNAPPEPSSRDLSVGPDGMAAPGDPERLLRLSEELARSMPR